MATDPEPLAARRKAVAWLARREHTGDELKDKLGKAGFSREAAEAAVAGLVRDGLQSDQRYVEAFVRSRIRQGKGPVRIRADLRRRGLAVTEAVIESAIKAADTDWAALACAVRQRKFGQRQPEFEDKARQLRFLRYRGFEAEQIAAAFAGASGGTDDR